MQRGEIRAIIGPNGAGKSTFFNCLTGVLRPTSGRILLNGENITGLSPDRISRRGIARSYQITNILPNATALENVRIAAQSRRHGWSMLRHYAAYRDLIDKADAVLESVGLLSKAGEFAANLPHGLERLGRAHAGGRLVEAEELRLGRERDADLEIALLAMRQVGGEL